MRIVAQLRPDLAQLRLKLTNFGPSLPNSCPNTSADECDDDAVCSLQPAGALMWHEAAAVKLGPR